MNATVPAFLTPEYCDEQYNPARGDVPEFPAIAQRWSRHSAEARASLRGSLDVRYGSTDEETIDVFPARGASRALMLFIHGGYWTFADKADFTFLAPPYVEKGVTFALANYALAPKVRLEEIVEQCRRAAVWLYRNAEAYGADPQRIYVSGHSSGGHLATLLMATDWRAYGPGLQPDLLKGGLSISGLHDLEPGVDAGGEPLHHRRRARQCIEPAVRGDTEDDGALLIGKNGLRPFFRDRGFVSGGKRRGFCRLGRATGPAGLQSTLPCPPVSLAMAAPACSGPMAR